MKPKLPLLLALGLATLGGCATARQRQSAELAASFGVSESIVRAMERGGRLSLDEIAALTQAGFPAEETLFYLKSGSAVYSLRIAQIDELRAAGVSDLVIDYMLGTPLRGNPGLFSRNRPHWPGLRGNHGLRGPIHTRGVH
ncbi:MAG: hypothetical protein ACOZE5_14690 [Verrucomicrobiota bacterium]